MQFLENTSLLKIEDILPFFPDFVTIDDFKDDICEALEGYSARIEALKQEMTLATESAEAIKRDIAELQNRFVVVDASAKCDACTVPLLERQFYVFPCQHSFHADCLIKEVGHTVSFSAFFQILIICCIQRSLNIFHLTPYAGSSTCKTRLREKPKRAATN